MLKKFIIHITILYNSTITNGESPSYKGFYSLGEEFSVAKVSIRLNYLISTFLKSERSNQLNKTYSKVIISLEKGKELLDSRITSERILMRHFNTLPMNISTYIISLAMTSTLQEFFGLQELLKLFHEKAPTGFSIIYEAEFNYKFKCKNKFPNCLDSKVHGCICRLH